MVSVPSPFASEVEEFLARTGMKPTTFGKVVAGDGAFVFKLRGGRQAGVDIADRARAYMREFRGEAEPTRRQRRKRAA